jgi:hypothetical protein
MTLNRRSARPGMESTGCPLLIPNVDSMPCVLELYQDDLRNSSPSTAASYCIRKWACSWGIWGGRPRIVGTANSSHIHAAVKPGDLNGLDAI